MELYRELGFEYVPLPLTDLQSLFRQSPGSAYRVETEPVSSAQGSGLEELRKEIGECALCRLSEARNNIVFGEGNPDADLFFIGEGPGREEDIRGRPFVGEAGKVLTSLIKKMGFRREDVYIANIVKCRPPQNRNPESDEIASCFPFLQSQIRIIRPKVIVSLGKISSQALLGVRTSISRLRGHFYSYEDIPVMPTFHPAYLMRNPKDKWLTWDDAQKVLERMGR